MALTTILNSYKRVGPGQLYLAAAPTSDPGTATVASTTDGYYALFYGSGAAPAGKVAKKQLTGGILPWGNLTASGMNLKIKPSTVDFDPNNGPKKKIVTGIEEAMVEFEFFDLNPAHLVDMFGSQAADLIAVAATTNVAGRKIAIIGPNANNASYVAMYRIPDPVLSGEYWHWLFPAANIIGELDLKLSKKDTLQAKITMSLDGSPFMNNAQGFPVVAVTDAPDAVAL